MEINARNLRIAALTAPLFFRKRLLKLARLHEKSPELYTERDAIAFIQTWRELRLGALEWFDEHESQADKILINLVQYMETEKERAAKCGAKCRTGLPCKTPVHVRPDGSAAKRCALHGGKSTGPKSSEGRAKIAESNRRRAEQSGQQLRREQPSPRRANTHAAPLPMGR